MLFETVKSKLLHDDGLSESLPAACAIVGMSTKNRIKASEKILLLIINKHTLLRTFPAREQTVIGNNRRSYTLGSHRHRPGEDHSVNRQRRTLRRGPRHLIRSLSVKTAPSQGFRQDEPQQDIRILSVLSTPSRQFVISKPSERRESRMGRILRGSIVGV